MLRMTGKYLNRKWKVGAKHSLFRETGNFYMTLRKFPGALFDPKGYLLFQIEEEYKNFPYLTHYKPNRSDGRKRINVPGGISSVPDYIQVIP